MLIAVAGAIANSAGKGGDTWHRLHWLLGLRRLGAQVHLIEQISRAACVDARGERVDLAASYNLAYFREVLAAFGLSSSATLLTDDGESALGLPLDDVRWLLADADLLVNISGHLDWKALRARPRRAVFVDEDPGFTQMWHVSGLLGGRLEEHGWHYSVGANVGTARATIPTGGIEWRWLRPFAVLSEWPQISTGGFDRFTTVAGWRGPCATVEFDGRTYGVKAHEFRKFHEVPQRTDQLFELALDIHPDERADIAMLQSGGWRLVDPRSVSATPQSFRTYVQTSGAEFSVAKEMYVATNSGWFSDRTIRYLASGRPAIVQDTGWGAEYPVGCGLLTFRTMDEAVRGCQRIVRDYAEHCDRARQVARDCFDSDNVLGQFLEEVGVGR